MTSEWHLLRDPQDPELDRLGERYHLHPLHIEDCRHRNQSAKVEEDGGYLFVVLKPVHIDAEGLLEVSDLDIFIGKDFTITVEEQHCPGVRKLLDQLRALNREWKPDELLYRIADGVVDSYLPLLDRFDERVDELQDAVLERPEPAVLSQIFDLKRNLILLRRVLVNTRDVAGHLQRSESPLIGRGMWPFLRDVYDHVARNLDTVDMLRDLLAGALDVYLSSVANRTNQVMKVLTVLSTIALPALIISGIYGMNVKGLPWMESPHGAIGVVVVAALCTLALLGLLKRYGWF